MPFGFPRKESSPAINIVIISAACCMPSMAPLDEQARRLIDQVLSETSVRAEVHIVPATNALFGAVPQAIMAELIRRAQSGQLPAPAVLLNGKPVAFGLADLANFKPALLAALAADPHTTKQEKPNDQGHLDESPV